MYRYIIISSLLLSMVPFSAAFAMENEEENPKKTIQRVTAPEITVDQGRKIFKRKLTSLTDENGRKWEVMLAATSKSKTYFSQDDLNYLSNQIVEIESPSCAKVEKSENNETFYTVTYFPARHQTMPSNDPVIRRLEQRMELEIILKTPAFTL